MPLPMAELSGDCAKAGTTSNNGSATVAPTPVPIPRKTARLEKELAAMKTEKVEGDEVLALLEDAGSAR